MTLASRMRWSQPPATGGLRRSVVANALRSWLATALCVREPKPRTSPPTKPRPGRVFQPDRGDLGAWRRLAGWRVQAGYDLAGPGGTPTGALVGTVQGFRVDGGQPVLTIDTGAACILIDPRWWMITAIAPQRRLARVGKTGRAAAA